MNHEIWIIYNRVNSGKLGHFWDWDDWENFLNHPPTTIYNLLQCPHGHEKARFWRDRKYSVSRQSMRSKEMIKNLYTHKCQLPVLMKPIMLNTERDFTPLWAHLKISAGPGSGRRQSAASTSWESLCFYFLFSLLPFSVPLLPSLSIYEF